MLVIDYIQAHMFLIWLIGLGASTGFVIVRGSSELTAKSVFWSSLTTV